ncbi:MAG TPA: hypothetical protein VG841_07150 [Caulobacterales bacterium]|nr:hypothetical protein [Caulobacterales bacterium]
MLNWSLGGFAALLGFVGVMLVVSAFLVAAGDATVNAMDLAPLCIGVLAGALLLYRRRAARRSRAVTYALLATAALAALALLHPAGVLLGRALGPRWAAMERYSILLVFALGAVGVATVLLAAALGFFVSARRDDRTKSSLEAFE